MEDKIRPLRMGRRDVDEKKLPSKPLQQQMPGQVQRPIIIPENRIARWSQRLQGGQDVQTAKIPQVPNFISLTQGGLDGCREISVGVGEDGDVEGSFQCSVFRVQ